MRAPGGRTWGRRLNLELQHGRGVPDGSAAPDGPTLAPNRPTGRTGYAPELLIAVDGSELSLDAVHHAPCSWCKDGLRAEFVLANVQGTRVAV